MDPANPNRRPPVRMNAQDGPWSVSVAETPDDPRSYSLYIKTPTHNLTLTRTIMELVDLDRKLREAYPTAALPDLPIDASAPKRKTKSTFLNTLSRLASPNANRGGRRPNGMAAATTPVTSPQAEANDPFLSFGPSDGIAHASAAPPASGKSTSVAAYLTTISNTPAMRQARVWKRFVHVRTDDLESVRVERAIKRVRSDLASHTGGGMRGKENIAVEKGIVEDDPPPPTPAPAEPAPSPAPPTDAEVAEMSGSAPAPASSSAAATLPVPESARIPRSQSADPDKSSRLSRAFSNTPDEQTDPEEQTSSQAGETDDSSLSTTGHGTAPKKRASKKKLRAISVGPRKSTRKVVIDDFEMMRVLGKGCAGKVLLVKHKTTADLYALKAITKRHVLAHQELQHTLTEQAVLKRMAAENKDPFVVKLWWSFHDKENLFLVMDFHPGGDLATQLARWGRLGRDRARFYAAEIVEGVEGLHAAGVIYRDLKPENILIGGDGHIVLTDFGLSKEFPRRTAAITAPSTPSGSRGEFYSAASTGSVVSANGSTVPATPPWMKAEKGGELAAGWPGQPVGQTADTTTTFCGTAEYLAPEVIQGLAYSYEVDWWSFGTMLYEMLTGITPFWANNHSDMYVRVLQDELQFPDDRAIDQDTKSLIRGLLQRNPALRICEPRIKRHPYFSMIDWSHVYYKRYIPPYIPPIDPSNASDTQNFDDTFLDMEPVLDDVNDEAIDTDQEPQTDAERTDGEESNTTPSQSRSSSIHPAQGAATTPGAEDDSVDVFDGYSFKGRHSVLMDDEDEESDGSGEEESEEEEEGDILKDLDVELEPETPKGAVVEDADADTAEAEGDADVQEPKTPEARPVVPVEPVPELPAAGAVVVADGITEEARTPESAPAPVSAPTPAEPKPRRSKEQPRPPVPEKDVPAPEVPPKAAKGARLVRPRREKSGVPALDRHIDDAEATEKEEEDDDDDWDFVEAADGEDRNGAKGTSLFARGVVDRYRLAVFRKASTPSQPRSVSAISRTDTEGASGAEGDSPSPSQRRGRTGAGLTFRKHPRQFLRPKSPPPSSYSSKSSIGGKSMSRTNSATISASSSSGGLLTPATSTAPVSPSLKSKESAMSMGAQSSSSGENGGVLSDGKAPGSPREGTDRMKSKKLKKYKENAEKVFHFLSPRQPT
ncbi:kinase-like protein [Mycena latifolia]|nr:kinase-like protein [Mycena latifolia]